MFKRLGVFVWFQQTICILCAQDYNSLYIDEYCDLGFTKTILTSAFGANSRGIIEGTRNKNYPTGKNCRLILQPPPGHGIVVSLEDISLRSSGYHFCMDYLVLSIEDGPRDWEDVIKSCNTYAFKSYQVIGRLRFDFHSDHSCCTFGSGFHLTYTTFQLAPCQRSDAFECANGNCVWNKLECDFHNNCGDESDEWLYEGATCSKSKTTTVIVAVVCSLVGVITVVAICVCICRRRQDIKKVTPPSSAPPTTTVPTAPTDTDVLYPPPSYPQNYGSTEDSPQPIDLTPPTKEKPPPYSS